MSEDSNIGILIEGCSISEEPEGTDEIEILAKPKSYNEIKVLPKHVDERRKMVNALLHAAGSCPIFSNPQKISAMQPDHSISARNGPT
jgi:hypothetical protein